MDDIDDNQMALIVPSEPTPRREGPMTQNKIHTLRDILTAQKDMLTELQELNYLLRNISNPDEVIKVHTFSSTPATFSYLHPISVGLRKAVQEHINKLMQTKNLIDAAVCELDKQVDSTLNKLTAGAK